jgi:hypothetical protein
MAGTPVYTLAPNPHWVVIDNFSKLPAGAVIYTYSTLDPSTFKAAFQDPLGMLPYGQPINGLGNGTFPPIYWEFDPNNPNSTYYIEVWSAPQYPAGNGVLLWTFDGLSGGISGGGGDVTETFNITNLITNGAFYHNIGTTTTTNSTNILIAPSNNAGFVNDPTNTTYGPTSPDIIFAKSNTTSTDAITFSSFPQGSTALLPDVTPETYVNYTCSVAGSGETYKFIQFPIAQGLQPFNGQPITLKFYAMSSSGSTITPVLRQFLGSGNNVSPNADIITTFGGGPITLTSSWTAYQFTIAAIPNDGALTIGNCGNDALYVQFIFQLSPSTPNVSIASPRLYLGNILAPGIDYETNDQINAIINTPRTGDVRMSLNSFMPGWVLMNDGTIGIGGSGATARANIDTFQLYDFIWNTFSTAIAPMGDGNPRGVNSFTDFSTNRTIYLTKQAGRVIAGVGSGSGLTTRTLGTITGSETITLNAMPAHTHNSLNGSFLANAGSAFQNYNTSTPNLPLDTNATTGAVTGQTGGGAADGDMQPTVFNNIFIKL